MKLHIGCGTRYFEGWTNLDIIPNIADIVDDATVLNKIPDGSCEIIYAAHVLEHFGRNEVLSILKLWKRKLKKGGILRLSVPDFEKIIAMYQRSWGLDSQLLGYITGGQRDQHDYHKMIFDEKSLIHYLHQAGFSMVRHWDWKTVEHGKYDDYSQAYLPHMDKDRGTMMSLNIEGIK